jgi:peptidoglycan/LPS O-acetylase OafA/YrhL
MFNLMRPFGGERATYLGDALDTNRGVGPGFDFLRVALALSIVGNHSVDVTYGDDGSFGASWVYGASLVPMFFALSGFLITASAQRLTISQFLLNRGLRIVPALFVEIVFSAVVLGAICTTLPLITPTVFSGRTFKTSLA